MRVGFPAVLQFGLCLGVQRSYGWKSRYVPEYSAIGEAPEEICDAVDAHYRHSRGYFQTFWSHQCPLLQRDLGLFYRLMYASRCFQAFASGAAPASVRAVTFCSYQPSNPCPSMCPHSSSCGHAVQQHRRALHHCP